MSTESLDFKKGNGLIPAVVQDNANGRVLMLGYMSPEALAKTEETGLVTFFSRSRNRLWTKGESSGHYLKLVSVTADCDNDTLLVRAEPDGPTCHTGADTCFGNPLKFQDGDFLAKLGKIIHERRVSGEDDTSYTHSLFSEGMNKIAQKVGEEAVEVIIEAKDQDREKFIDESADLLYHFLVLLEAKDVTLDDVKDVLEKRHEKK